MEDQQGPTKPVEDQFARLGENLRKAMEEAWQTEKRKQISDDFQKGFSELGEALNRTTSEFVESPTGQRLRETVEDFSKRVQEGEVADKVESELMRVLERLNQKLEEAISSMASERQAEDSPTEE